MATDLITVELSADDLLAINNALNEVCSGANAIPEWEFQTLIDVERGEALKTLGRIGGAFERLTAERR